MKKVFIGIIIIVILAIVIVGAVYVLLVLKPCAWLHTGYRNADTGKCENFSSCGIIPNKYILDSACLDQTAGPALSQVEGWKTYTNTQYGFEVKYPTDLKIISSGPNDAQQSISKGEQISGTVQPSYDTITLSDDYGTLGSIGIFDKYSKDISEENYQGSYLYLFGPCYVRWGFSPESFSSNYVNNIKILTVKGKDQNGISQSCNYLKNSDGNLITISNEGYKSDIFNQIISTFKFITPQVQSLITVKPFLHGCDGPGGGKCSTNWTSSGLSNSDKVSILLINKPDNFYYTLNNSTILLGLGTFSWDMPSNLNSKNKSKFQIRVCDLNTMGPGTSVCGESDYFTIYIND